MMAREQPMYAIFENGSHQYRVSEGDEIVIDRQPGEPGCAIHFDKVLLVAGPDGATIGRPLVEGAKVEATLIDQFRGKKIIIQKFRRRKNYRRRRAHRQHFSTIRITSVG
jgi:large subunit ribosomal protein L21